MARSSKEPHPLDLLPFTALRDGKELPKADLSKGECGRCFWHVKPTGDYSADCETGNRYALEYLAYEESDATGMGVLGMIVAEMPRPLTGIEVGFLQLVCSAARAGAPRARQIRAYWDKCAALEAVKEVEAA